MSGLASPAMVAALMSLSTVSQLPPFKPEPRRRVRFQIVSAKAAAKARARRKAQRKARKATRRAHRKRLPWHQVHRNWQLWCRPANYGGTRGGLDCHRTSWRTVSRSWRGNGSEARHS